MGTNTIGSPERRAEPRMNLDCPVKLYDPRGGRYLAARTVDVSAGGALLEVAGSIGGGSGDEFAVAIDWTQVHPLFSRSDFRSVRLVRRAVGPDGRPRIAVRFAEPNEAVRTYAA